jgi:hypothetical protein
MATGGDDCAALRGVPMFHLTVLDYKDISQIVN